MRVSVPIQAEPSQEGVKIIGVGGTSTPAVTPFRPGKHVFGSMVWSGQ